MANSKMTKREIINTMLADENICSNATYVSYLENELGILDRKGANKKATKVQTENIGLKQTILNTLKTLGKAVTVSELQNANPDLSATVLSNQKVSALLRQLKDEGMVDKFTDKRKTYFSAVVTEVEGD